MVLLLSLSALAGCCTPVECSPENLPKRGHALEPEDLADLIRYTATHECYRELYDLVSPATREAHSYAKFRLGINSIDLPAELGGYPVMDVLRGGRFVDAMPNPRNPNERIAWFRYPPDTPKERIFELLLVPEMPEGRCKVIFGDAPEWRLGLQDQIDRRLRWSAD